MDKIADMDFGALRFDDAGNLTDAAEAASVIKAAATHRDVIVISHGWRNSEAFARRLYEGLLVNVRQRLRELKPDLSAPFVVGVFWPSLDLPEGDDGAAASGGGGAAGLDERQVPVEVLRKRLVNLTEGARDADVKKLLSMVGELEASTEARKAFVEQLRELVQPDPVDPGELAGSAFWDDNPVDLFEALKDPALPGSSPRGPDGQTMGGAAAFDDAPSAQAGFAKLDTLVSGVTGAVARMLNYLTYYKMKQRAGIVGGGLGQELGRLTASAPNVRLHLIGHSFGARVVTSAIHAQAGLAASSMSLLQGAFSHNGFGVKTAEVGQGFFRDVVAGQRVKGVLMATFTANDEAVGTAYPLASRLAHDSTAGFGDASDIYGGIGRNGALHLQQSEWEPHQMVAAPGPYQFRKGKVANVSAGNLIRSHGDVTNKDVANAVAQAILQS